MQSEVELIKRVHINLNGRVGLVTGGASGLGKATVRRFLQSNAKVVICDYNEKISQEVLQELIGEFGPDNVDFIKTDVSDDASMKAAVDFAVERFGSLDILVASAGIGGANNAIADETIDNWNRVNAVDYTGVMLSNKYAIMQFRKQGNGGVIVNLASMFGLVAVPTNVAYSAAKGGVINLTKAAGTAYADEGIRVNCVCPGAVNTPLVPEDQKQAYRNLHPMHRIAEAHEIASIITFLCSDDARFITGAAIPVDGGYTGV